MKATQYSTNKYGEFIPYTLKPALYMGGSYTAQKCSQSENTNFMGFGVAITGSSCYNLSKMPKSERRQLLEHIYGKNGLGLSIGRLSIGSSDYSAELYTYDDTENDIELKDFSIERDMEYIIPIIKEIIEINPEIKLFASPWTPPGWMKTGGSSCGGHMRKKYISCYADYFVKYLKAYKENGIDIIAVTPQNEPETHQNGAMPACIWNPETEAEFISILRQKLTENKLNTQIWMHDHNFAHSDKVEWLLREFESLKNECNGVAFHYYSGNIEQTRYIKDMYPSLNLHFTEGGPRLYDHYSDDWCKWAIMMCKTLNNMYSSFTGWNLMLDETGGPNIGPFFCGGLVTLNKITNELSYSGQYKAFKHFSPFINENSSIYPITFIKNNFQMFGYPNTGKLLEGTLIENPDGKKYLILVNPNESKAQVQYFCGDKWWYIELLPETVSTVCFDS